MAALPFTDAQIARAHDIAAAAPPESYLPDPRVEALVTQLIGRVADKWTMLILEALEEGGELRFTALGRAVPGVSQKMLTQRCARWSATAWCIAPSMPSCPRASTIA